MRTTPTPLFLHQPSQHGLIPGFYPTSVGILPAHTASTQPYLCHFQDLFPGSTLLLTSSQNIPVRAVVAQLKRVGISARELHTKALHNLSQQLFCTDHLQVGPFLWNPSLRELGMGKTSTESRFNLPGRVAWSVAEVVGPINLIYILYTAPARAGTTSSGSLLGTGLPVANEILGSLFVLHYLNRALITPLFFAPSMSPIHPEVAVSIVIFQFVNSSNLASWLVYSTSSSPRATDGLPPFAAIASLVFFAGLLGNILAEHTLFDLRRGAARRKAKSEGKAEVTYDKVYVVPPAEGFYKYILFPHYVLEWVEWTGYWIMGGLCGLGWDTPALWFLIAELAVMPPRAVRGRYWYEKKFGKRAIGGRGAFAPVSWL